MKTIVLLFLHSFYTASLPASSTSAVPEHGEPGPELGDPALRRGVFDQVAGLPRIRSRVVSLLNFLVGSKVHVLEAIGGANLMTRIGDTVGFQGFQVSISIGWESALADLCKQSTVAWRACVWVWVCVCVGGADRVRGLQSVPSHASKRK